MSNQSTIQPGDPLSGTRRRRARALNRGAGVLVAAGAMVAAAFVVAAPAGASTTSAPGADLQTLAAASPSGGWATTGSMRTPRVRHAAARLADGRVLVAGGSNSVSYGVPLSSSELYNTDTGTWQTAADMPIAVADAAAVTLPDGTVLVAGGTGTATELYHPTTDTWTVGASMPAANFGTTFAATLPNGNVFVLGNSAASYNPVTKAWTALAAPPAMGTSTNNDTTMLVNGDILTLSAMQYTCCMPGYPTTGPAVYHWATNTWTTLPVPPVNPGDSNVSLAVLPDGNVVLAGGGMGYLWFPEAVTTVMEVNPTTGTWTIDDNPQQYFLSDLVALSNGFILATAGSIDFDYIYNPTVRTWTEVPGRGTYLATFTTLTNGTLLAAGGSSGTVPQSHAAIFDPTSTPTPPPATHHIGDLDNATGPAASSLQAASSAKWQPKVTATVLDSTGAVVAGATVSGTFSSHRGTLTCTTAANGTCTMGNFSLSQSTKKTVFTVTNVLKASSTYVPTANSDPDGDSNGTSITLKRS